MSRSSANSEMIDAWDELSERGVERVMIEGTGSTATGIESLFQRVIFLSFN